MEVKSASTSAQSSLPSPASVRASTSISSEIEVRVRKRFLNPEGSFVLNVHFHALAGFTILFGASGAGKTTLLDCIAGLTDPDEGRIVVGGQREYDSASKYSTPAWKRNIGYVLQDLALFPHLTAGQNVEYGLRHLGVSERRARSRELLNAFRIEHLRERRPAEISGGERQRVALARALVIEPRALLLDEPLVALDRPIKSLILSDLRRWNQTYRIPMLFVTHSGEEVFALGEEVIVLEAGKIAAQGLPKDVMHAPRLETVAQLAGFENIFNATVTAVNEASGTMTCSIGGLNLETPLGRAEVGAKLRVGIRAGDIMLAIEHPHGLSARNILPGTIYDIEHRHGFISALVDCGSTRFEVHLTLAAREDLNVTAGKNVWIVVKTHSCHLMER
ncbi:MAG: molybdenum ABC transporter ATP-binding protein [Terriglobales bacterium]